MSAPKCRPEWVIKESPQWEITRYRDGETEDIIETILYADTRSSGFIRPGVECLVASTQYKTLENIWRFVKYNIKYRADRSGHERIKSPGALFTSGYGDCKSLSIATGAILRALRIPYQYRFASYDSGDFSHVYVVADGVDGPVILDAVYDYFDEEHPYIRRKDIRPKSSPKPMAGIGQLAASGSGLLIGMLLVWGLSKFWK